MTTFKDKLIEERNHLQDIIRELEKNESDYPEGTLQISVNGNRQRYYQHLAGKNRYIEVADRNLPRQLAQKKYEQQVLRLARKRWRQFNDISKDYQENEIEDVYLSLHPARKELVEPIEPIGADLIEAWLNQKENVEQFHSEKLLYPTLNGETVRSKSEKIIADYFYSQGIPYQYEKQLHTARGIISPDFTFYFPKRKQQIFWEHFGMMDNSQYAEHALMKINMYIEEGIIPGERLITTFESSSVPLDMKAVKTLTEFHLSQIMHII